MARFQNSQTRVKSNGEKSEIRQMCHSLGAFPTGLAQKRTMSSMSGARTSFRLVRS
jgi:hypothetical protein